MTYTNGREANREAIRISGENRSWVYVRKANFHVEEYTLETNGQPGDRAYFCGRSMPF